MSDFNKDIPSKMLGNSKKPFQNDKDEKKLLSIKKSKTETKQAKLYISDHKRLRIASAMNDKNMIDILSEAIDLWIEKNDNQ